VERDWWVYSTVIEERAILVECRVSGARGSINDPTREEWRQAFHAPSQPYRWLAPARVVEDAAIPVTV
jgi:hypothetical protein